MVFYGFFQRLVIPVAVQKDRGLWERDCAIAYNIVELRFGGHGTKEMLRVVGSKVSPVSKLTQQLPTSNRVT